MSKIVRTKEPGSAWGTSIEPTSGGGGGAIKQTRVTLALADIPVKDVPAPGDGAVVYTPEVGEVLIPALIAVSIAAGNGFDGDYALTFYIDGQQATGGLGNVIQAGDEDTDGSSFADVGLTKFAGIGPSPVAAVPEAPYLNTGRWQFKTTDPIVALFTGGTPGSEPTIGGPFTIILGTMPPA